MCQCSCGTRRCPGFRSSASKHLVMRWAVDDSFERSWTLDAWDASKWFKYIQMQSNASYRSDSSWHIMTGWSSWAHTFGLPIRYFSWEFASKLFAVILSRINWKAHSMIDWIWCVCVCTVWIDVKLRLYIILYYIYGTGQRDLQLWPLPTKLTLEIR